jgi:hypothetical protein
MIATNAGQAAVAAGLLAWRASDERTVKPCGPVPPTLGTSLVKQVSLNDEG